MLTFFPFSSASHSCKCDRSSNWYRISDLKHEKRQFRDKGNYCLYECESGAVFFVAIRWFVTQLARNEIWRSIYRPQLLTDWYAGLEVTVYVHAMWQTGWFTNWLFACSMTGIMCEWWGFDWQIHDWLTENLTALSSVGLWDGSVCNLGWPNDWTCKGKQNFKMR